MRALASLLVTCLVVAGCSGEGGDAPGFEADDPTSPPGSGSGGPDAGDPCAGRADGAYCGARVGEGASSLVVCRGGRVESRSSCPSGCFEREPGDAGPRADVCASDAVDPCFNDADGVYCGGEIGGDARTLFTCKGKRTEKREVCKDGCYARSDPGTPDACASDAVDPCFNDPDGAYCGDAIGGPAGKLYRCAGKRTASVEACGAPGCLNQAGARPDECNGQVKCGAVQWWTVPLTYGPYMSSSGWWDTDLAVSANSEVVLRHASRLDKTGVYAWGYMPEFTDLVTGKRFRMLHLRPQQQRATDVGRVYPAGFVVGISGGDTADTGKPTYSTGAHLCIQTLEAWRTVFPDGRDACK